MWDKLTPDQISKRKAAFVARRVTLSEEIKALDAEIAKIESLERDIVAFLEHDKDFDAQETYTINSAKNLYASGIQAVLIAVQEHDGITRSDIIKYMEKNFNRRLSRNTVSTYLNRFSQEGKVLYMDGKWYPAAEEEEVPMDS